MKCETCGDKVTTRVQPFDYTAWAGLDPGQYTIIVEGLRVQLCSCGEAPEVPNLEGLHYAIALALITHPTRLRPSAHRFLRKTLGQRQVEFAELVGVRPETVSLWENGPQLPEEATEMQVRARVLDVLLDRAEVRSKVPPEKMRELLRRLVQRREDTPSDKPIEIKSPPPWMIPSLAGGSRMTARRRPA